MPLVWIQFGAAGVFIPKVKGFHFLNFSIKNKRVAGLPSTRASSLSTNAIVCALVSQLGRYGPPKLVSVCCFLLMGSRAHQFNLISILIFPPKNKGIPFLVRPPLTAALSLLNANTFARALNFLSAAAAIISTLLLLFLRQK